MILKGKKESACGWGRNEGNEGEEGTVKEGERKKGSSKGRIKRWKIEKRKEGRMESVDQMSSLGPTNTFRVITSPLRK